jgi:hypothetical protein
MKVQRSMRAMAVLGLVATMSLPATAVAAEPDCDQAMVMGDLVLLDQEVPAVMSGLFSGGLEVTAVHNHLNEMSPHVMYMHYAGHGEAVQLAKALRQALSASGTPLGGATTAPSAAGPTLDTEQIEQTEGRIR